jgi:hypothetical protein
MDEEGERKYYRRILFFKKLYYLLDKFVTLDDVLLQFRDSLGDEFLFVVRDFTETVDLFNTFGTEFDVGGEVFNTFLSEDIGLNERGFNNTLLTTDSSFEDRVGHTGTSIGHGESGRTSTVLGLNNFITTELDTVSQSIEFFLGEFETGLRKERDNGDTRVTTDNGDLDILGVRTLDFRNETRGTDNIKSGNTIETLGVENTSLLEGFSENRDGGVDRVGDDEEVSVRAVPGKTQKVSLLSLFSRFLSLSLFVTYLAAAVARSRTIEALVLNKSSRVIPGLRGTPAGITTT